MSEKLYLRQSRVKSVWTSHHKDADLKSQSHYRATYSGGRGSQSVTVLRICFTSSLINEYGFPPESLSVSGIFRFRFTLVTTTERGQTQTHFQQ